MKKIDIGLTILTTLLIVGIILIFYFGVEYLKSSYELMKYEPLTIIDQIIIFCVCCILALLLFRGFYIISKSLQNRF